MNDAQRARYEASGRFCQPFNEFMTTVLVMVKQQKGTTESVSKTLETEVVRMRDLCLGNRFSAAEVDEALFAVCAWADEVLMNATWPGVSERWVTLLLQQKFFNTNIAGEEFFVRIERLSTSDSLAFDVYAFCLANGFKGKFAHALATDDLAQQRNAALSRTLVLARLNDANKQTFTSIGHLAQKQSKPKSHWRVAVVVISTLLALKVLDWILHGLLSHRVYTLIESWR